MTGGILTEAAEILGISEAACRKKMQRIRQKISDAFGTDLRGKKG